MKLTNPWVGYLDRSYKTVKTSILNRIKTLVPEITDLSDSNILVILVGIFAGIVEQLNYYIDATAREVYITTARKFESMIQLVKLINYRVRSSMSASVDLTFTVPVQLDPSSNLTIMAGTILQTIDGVQFVTTKSLSFLPYTSSLVIPARQRVFRPLYVLATSDGSTVQKYNLPSNYEDNTLVVEIDSVTWELQDDLSFSKPTDKHFYVTTEEYGVPVLRFGEGIQGAIPPSNKQIKVSYYTTLGKAGNLITPGSITEIVSDITLPVQVPTIDSISVTNLDYPAGGTDPEGTEEIRKFAPLSLRTLNRAITKQDYIDITRLAPGVDKAAVLYDCGKKIKVYISPIGGGIAANSLLASTADYLESRKMITTFIEVKAAGETYLKVDIEATARFRVNPTLVENDIREALIQTYSGSNSNINKPIRLSDIIALIDNLERVDFLSVHFISAVPYARPIDHEKQLDWTREVMEGSVSKIRWKIIYTGGVFKLYKDTDFVQDIPVAVEVSYQDILKCTINAPPPSITNGDTWEFYTYPHNQDIVLDDYTVPRIHPSLSYVTLKINSQSYING